MKPPENHTWKQGVIHSNPSGNERTPLNDKINQEGLKHLQHQEDEPIKNKCLFCCCMTTILCISWPCALQEMICDD